MTPRIEFLDAAELEASDAVAWYEENEVGLGSDLRSEIEVAVDRIAENPNSFPVVFRSDVRRVLTDRFPYSIFFRILEEDTVLIISVFHHSRNPIIWKGRID